MTKRPRSRSLTAPLPAFVEADLVAEAPRLPPTFLAEDRINEVIRLLEAGGRHPVLVGPHDSGKSAIVRAIALGISAGARPAGACALWRISMRAIELATHKDGTFVPALSQVITDAAASKSRPIVWIPDVHLARAYDVHAVLALLLERTGVRMIGEALPPFDRQCLDDVELANSLHPLRMPEATEAHTRALLEAYREWLCASGRTVRKSAVDRAMTLSRGAFANRALPGRAFRALSLALEATDPSEPLTAKAVTRALERTVDVSPAIGESDARSLRAALDARIVGQPEAIATLVDRYVLWKSGAAQRDRPACLVLLAGPPGVGKSHVAREFGRAVLGHEEHIITIYGGEFAEDWKVDQLLGQVGANAAELRRGLLAQALGGAAVSVVLIDEIERANPLLMRWILRIADTGSFITGSGELVSLRNTFVIVTTNAGCDAFRDRPLGIGPEQDCSRRIHALRRAIETMLPPELFERVDSVVVCAPLDESKRFELASRWLAHALERIRQQHGRVPSIANVDESLRSIAARSHDARSLRLALERELLAPIANAALLTGALRATDHQGAVSLSTVGESAP
jgi:ATP-dependent Clp protease ATP-binding subunit ClpA